MQGACKGIGKFEAGTAGLKPARGVECPPHKYIVRMTMTHLVQSRKIFINARVAQLVEHLVEAQGVGGSSPSPCTIIFILFCVDTMQHICYIMKCKTQ